MLVFVLMAGHLGAFLGLLAASVGGGGLVAAVLALGASLAAGIAGEGLRRTSGAVVALAIEPDGSLRLTERGGRELVGRPAGASLVSPWVLILTVAPEGRARRRSVVVMPDAADAEDLRRLRVHLRWRRPRGEVASGG